MLALLLTATTGLAPSMVAAGAAVAVMGVNVTVPASSMRSRSWLGAVQLVLEVELSAKLTSMSLLDVSMPAKRRSDPLLLRMETRLLPELMSGVVVAWDLLQVLVSLEIC